jgi:hypothetical protein
VTVTNRKVERYRKALDQVMLRDFPLGADLFPVGVPDGSLEIGS